MSTLYRNLFLAGAVAGLLAIPAIGCTSAPTPGQGNGIDTNQKGNVPAIDHPPLDPEKRPVTSASVQRLSVAQLRNTFPVVLGTDQNGKDITWIVGSKAGFDAMSAVLGEPDYDKTTAEDLTPSPLYLKFMDDAARDACTRVLNSDAAKTAKTDRSFVRFAELTDTDPAATTGIDDNLRYLKLRYHAVKLDPKDGSKVADLRTLFSAGVKASTSMKAQDQARSGWMVVCVAMLTAPEFHLY